MSANKWCTQIHHMKIYKKFINEWWYGSFKEVGVYYDVVNFDNVVYYIFPELCSYTFLLTCKIETSKKQMFLD